ncbi:TPA: hypothetical protein NVH30_003760 [Vibrio cholerae]|nr:hypothetical protein [Vibrio cholerae]HCJ7281317.1 hypothetical protein [Vibrio cholerae]HCJ7319081.1 hypothetical protein [Vibrio cholerae]
MSLYKLFEIRTGGTLIPEECSDINLILVQTNIDSIPEVQTGNVIDYIESALLMDVVKQEQVNKITDLLEDLKARQNG